MELGDLIEQALDLVGISQESVGRWLGKPCNCEERKEKLNQLSAWARRVCKGKLQDAAQYFTMMVE